jgi:hypothetical protein
MSQLSSFVFWSICFLFLIICCLQFSLQSKVNPRYLSCSFSGMLICFICTGGQEHFRRVKVVCVDSDSLTLIFHLLSHASMRLRYSCRCEEAA